ncbi:MAG: BolA protein [Candidatus Tokpelaia sp. JSC188]|nr:MAG: BolA protein [Candidatus Tokpelaia sp. JSC188]
MSRSVQETIKKKLYNAFDPTTLDVIDESHLHLSHYHMNDSLFDKNTETHFRVKIVSRVFFGMKRIDRHRAINQILRSELVYDIHALAIEARAPDE